LYSQFRHFCAILSKFNLSSVLFPSISLSSI
jgi:hypothetical protein